MKNKNTDFIVKGAVIAAFYAVLTIALGPLSYSPFGIGIELRASEILTILPVFTPAAIPGLTIGCIIANLVGMSFSPLGIVDIAVGSFASLIAAYLSYKLRKIEVKGLPLISFLPPVLVNAIFIGAELSIILPDEISFIYGFLSIGLGELIVVLVGGIPFYFVVKKTKLFDK